jgi:hypothetical protein
MFLSSFGLPLTAETNIELTGPDGGLLAIIYILRNIIFTSYTIETSK